MTNWNPSDTDITSLWTLLSVLNDEWDNGEEGNEKWGGVEWVFFAHQLYKRGYFPPAPAGAPVTREALAPKIAENYSGERDWGRLYHSERSSYCEIADALLATYDIRERVP